MFTEVTRDATWKLLDALNGVITDLKSKSRTEIELMSDYLFDTRMIENSLAGDVLCELIGLALDEDLEP